MGRLVILMVTAFVDMMGGLIVFPLVPFYAKRFLGHGPLWSVLDGVGLGGRAEGGCDAGFEDFDRAGGDDPI